MYERVKRHEQSKASHDWSLSPHIIVVVVLAAAIIAPFVRMGSLMYRFQSFKQDLAASMAYAERQGTLPGSQGDRLFSLVVDAGMGKPQDAVPNSAPARMDFGDGSSLELWEVAIDGNPGNPGTLLRYTRADGDVFCYDTDKIAFEVAADLLTSP